jgi:hypothetical protein
MDKELEELVVQDMLLAGFDPKNPEEVRKYWAARGVRNIVVEKPLGEDFDAPKPQFLAE